MKNFINYYETLQINKGASSELIEFSYQTLVKQYQNDSKQLQLINEAHETLSNYQKRKEYDKLYVKQYRTLKERIPKISSLNMVLTVICIIIIIGASNVINNYSKNNYQTKNSALYSNTISPTAPNTNTNVSNKPLSNTLQQGAVSNTNPKSTVSTSVNQSSSSTKQQVNSNVSQPIVPNNSNVTTQTTNTTQNVAINKPTTSTIDSTDVMSPEMIDLANQFINNPFNTKLPKESMQLYNENYKNKPCKGIVWADDLSFERYPFVNDSAAIGDWKAVDYVNSIPMFDPNVKAFTGTPTLREIKLSANGFIAVAYNSDPLPNRTFNYRWTQGFIMEGNGDNIRCKYVINTIDGKQYLFLEWKSGDYSFSHQINGYYVFEK